MVLPLRTMRKRNESPVPNAEPCTLVFSSATRSAVGGTLALRSFSSSAVLYVLDAVPAPVLGYCSPASPRKFTLPALLLKFVCARVSPLHAVVTSPLLGAPDATASALTFRIDAN